MAAPHPSVGGETSFRGLVILHRGRTGLPQREVAARLRVNVRSIQAWEAGVNYPTADRLRALIGAYLSDGGFRSGHEVVEAELLWDAALSEAPRLHEPFDHAWFSRLLAERGAASPATASISFENHAATPAAPAIDVGRPGQEPAKRPASVERMQDWGEAPDVSRFIGRGAALAVIGRWVCDEHCRVLALLGLGGIGKTSLAARLGHDLAPSFERVYWRSVRNAPAPAEWLGGAIAFLSDQQVLAPDGEAERLGLLLKLMRTRRCLLVLDNLEAVLEPGAHQVAYRTGYAGYGAVLQTLGQSEHPSCMVLTSRESPPELALLAGEQGPVRIWDVGGLSSAEGQALLSDKRLQGDATAWISLVTRYGGNGLALQVVGESIRQVFGGAIGSFLAQAGSGSIFGGIRRLLDSQFERLSPLEQQILAWFAIEREPVSFSDLIRDLGPSVAWATVIEAVEALRRRSLLELSEAQGFFTLQSVVLEYMTHRLVERATHESELGQPGVLVTHPLVQAQSKDYVRRSQERLIAEPLLQRLTAVFGSRPTCEQRLLAQLGEFRARPVHEQQYGPGNLVNLLRLLRGDLRGLDLSGLHIRQAYLSEVEAQDARLVGSALIETVFAEPFNYPTSIALASNASCLAAGTSTGDVCLWRLPERTLVTILRGGTGGITGLALSADGRFVAAGGEDQSVRAWALEPDGERLLAALPAHDATVRCVALADDLRVLASGGEDAAVRLWDAGAGQLVATLDGHARAVWAIGLTRDGRLLASGGDDERVCLWDVETRRLTGVFDGHGGGVRGLVLTPDGACLASAAFDGTIRLWDVRAGRLLLTLQAHTGGILSLAMSEDAQLLGSASLDGTVRLWEAPSGRALATLQGHTTGAWGVQISADRKLVATSGFDATVRLWEAENGALVSTLQGRGTGILGVALSRDGGLVVCASFDGSIRIWETRTGVLRATLSGHTSGVRSVALSRDGRLLASASLDGSVRLWEVASGRQLSVLRGHTGGVWGVSIADNGSQVVSAGLDGTVRLWATVGGHHQRTLAGHTGGVWGAVLATDSSLVVSSGFDGALCLWDANTGRLRAALRGHSASGRGLAVSHNRDLIAVGSTDGTVRLWDPDSCELRATLEGHVGQVNDVALSESSELLASAGHDGTVRLWRIHEHRGQHLATLADHDGPVWSVAVSGDEQMLVSGGDDGVVRLWDLSSGECVRTLRADRRYERMDITGTSGMTAAQRATLLALGARERDSAPPVLRQEEQALGPHALA
jgi:WD40 repeat protein